jgi:iron complex transport system substrate-binding protein
MGGKMSAYGPGSRFGMIHDALGIKPAIEGLAVATHGQAISAELVLKANPDWLFVLDRDGAVGQGSGAAKRALENELIAQTAAWKKDQVVYLDPMNWYLAGGGIQSLQANLDQIRRPSPSHSLHKPAIAVKSKSGEHRRHRTAFYAGEAS